ncbi:MAG: hypothetical protein Q9159_007692 [Coniocarpon cinnabarinum]
MGLIAAIGEIVSLGTKAAEKLHQVSQKLSNYSNNANRLRSQVDATTRLLLQVQTQLSEQDERHHQPQLLQDLRASVQACREVLREIQDSAQLVLDESQSPPLLQKLKHTLMKESKIDEYRQELNYCLTTLLGFVGLVGHGTVQANTERLMDLAKAMSTRKKGTIRSFSIRELQDGSNHMPTPSSTSAAGPGMVAKSSALASGPSSGHFEGQQDPIAAAAVYNWTERAQMIATTKKTATLSSSTVIGASGTVATESSDRSSSSPGDIEAKTTERPLPSFSIYLGRRTSNVRGHGWHFVEWHASPDTKLQFWESPARDYLKHTISKLDSSTLETISQFMRSIASEVSVLKVRNDNKLLRRFLKPTISEIDLLTKPQHISTADLVEQLRDQMESPVEKRGTSKLMKWPVKKRGTSKSMKWHVKKRETSRPVVVHKPSGATGDGPRYSDSPIAGLRIQYQCSYQSSYALTV